MNNQFTASDLWVVRERLPLPGDVKRQLITSTGWIRNSLWEFTFEKEYVTVAKRGKVEIRLCIGWRLFDISLKDE